ncbi:MAG: hypothetical protein Q3982_09675, partial [Phoenicibacter congonensis]|nr:hypothetical protein [Phoenicibacter congonensis]
SSEGILPVQNEDLENASIDNTSPVQNINPQDITVEPKKFDVDVNAFAVPSVDDVVAHVLRNKMSLDQHDINAFIDYYNKSYWVTGTCEPVNWLHKLTNWETRKLEAEQRRAEQAFMAEERARQIAENAEKVEEAFEQEREEERQRVREGCDTVSFEKLHDFVVAEGLVYIDEHEFLAHYDGNGWRDASGKYISDWRRKAREWDRRGAERKTTKAQNDPVKVEPDRATLEEIKAYVAERELQDFDCEKFFNYYKNMDWHNKYGQPVRYWKTLIEEWDSRDKTQTKAIERTAQVQGSWEEKKAREKAMKDIRLLEGNLEYFNENDEQQCKEKEKCLASIAELKEKWGIE